MARWLTNEEMVLLKAGLRPVLYSLPFNSDEPMDMCIGWASSAREASRMLRRHPMVPPSIKVLPQHPDYLMTGAMTSGLFVGDEDGYWLLEPHAPYPGTYYTIQCFCPVYGLKKKMTRKA